MTEPKIAEVEALREEGLHSAEMPAHVGDGLVALCDYWLAAHRSAPATPNTGALDLPRDEVRSIEGASAGTISTEDAELCKRLREHVVQWEDHDRGQGGEMSIRDWQRHGDTNVGLGMVYDSPEEKEITRLNEKLRAAEARSEAMARELRERNDQVIDLCNVLDRAGEEFQFDPSKPEDQGAADYFCTVSKNAGLARLVCEESNAALAAEKPKP